ncbi:MAG: S8 family serine peptidase [Bacteroidota bacterium]|nr:S8 family serine peptidase [Bacteroidota bacterium]
MRTLKIFIFTILLFANSFVFAQSKSIIIKFKSSTPTETLNNFKRNSPKSGNNSVSKLSKDLDIKNSSEVFKKTNEQNPNNDSYKKIGLDKIFVMEVDEKNLEQLISLGKKNEYIEYIEPNRRMQLEGVSDRSISPNDTYYGLQYYLELIGMQNVWDITLGDSNVVIGVIDSGLDFFHPDLQTSFKINYGEYGNGKESNGIDDDQNGFIDDYRGWDFTDEPFTGDPTRGDYLDPDNDPTDDNVFSHGTAVTGIINASFNNNLGISSVAPKCKVLVLRAFDAQGGGEEDDVANAVLYGISRGVRIFNFSFGDVIFSNLLRDVVRYAYTRNVFISCSAGNNGRDDLHYPSAYDEVTSVAFSDEDDFRAGQASFGETVDIFAPAVQSLTTSIRGRGNSTYNSDYEKINGSSFAAPLVAGVAGLLLSRNPDLTNEELRGIMVSSTSFMPGQTAWDHTHSSGRLNALSSIQNFDKPSIVRINYPHQDFTFEDNVVPICISAASPLLLSYSVFYGVGENPSSWIPILENQPSQVLNDTVAHWNTTSLPDTAYTLRLAINSNSGRTIEHRMIIFKDRNPPIITALSFGSMIDKNNFSELIVFATNKRTLGKIYYKRKNINEPYEVILADIGTPNIGFIADVHFGLLGSNELSQNTEYEFYVEAISLNGKTTIVNDTSFYFYTQPQINNYGYIQKSYSLPFAQSCNKILDLDNNGLQDIFLNVYGDNLDVYEFNNGSFSKKSNGNWGNKKIARDAGDIDNDGRIDLLTSDVRNGFLYEAPQVNQLPVNLVWGDSSNNSFWSTSIADVNNNGINEILGFGHSGLRILESSGSNNSFNTIANLDFFGKDSIAASPNVIVEDLDGDGLNEIFFVNYMDRDSRLALSVYENTSGNNFNRTFKDTIDRILDDNFNIISGDFLGNGNKAFAIGTVSSQFDLIQYYSLLIYQSAGNDSYSILDVVDIYNYKSNASVSTKAGDIDNDGKDEILINVGTLFYILKFDNNLGRFTPVYYKPGINSSNQIIFDFDGNGVKEIGLNTIDDTLLFFEKDIAFAGPSTPLNLQGYSMDSNLIKLSFENVAGADYYRVYRSDTTQNYSLYDSTNIPEYTDVNVINRENYFYKVSSINILNPVRESNLSNPVKVYCHNKSKILSATYEENGFLSIKFSEKVASTIPHLNSFTVNNNVGYPKNIAVKNNFEYFLTFEPILQNGIYSIKANFLKDFYNSPVDTNSVSLVVNQIDTGKFYISKLELSGSFRLKVQFNLEVDSASAQVLNNYSFEPFDLKAISVQIDNLNRKIVYINLETRGVIGATGKNYLLKASDIYSSTGIRIVNGAGNSFGLIFNKETLDEMYVYPNPFSINSTQGYVTFANITRDASIDIYDLSGKFLINVQESNGNGGVEWNMKDGGGNQISTGIYLYRATGKNSSGQDVEEKIGKFAIIK